MARVKKAKKKVTPKTKSKKAPKEAPEKVLPLKRTEKTQFLERAGQFLKEVKIEFRRITWPSRKETTQTTVAVISFTLFVSVYLGLIDTLLSKLVQFLIY
ncbi:preprotein translocase subunit SecE [Thermosulfuriphilus sp.]